MPTKLDLKGIRFGSLVAIEQMDKRICGRVVWKCICDCGNYHEVTTRDLRNGDTKSCGECKNKWHIFKDRCECVVTNKKNQKTIFIVDIEDYEKIKHCHWYIKDNGYVFNNKLSYLHRFILNAPYGLVVDHISGDKLNNTKSNLRICSIAQNNRNIRKSSKNKSGYIGVYLDKKTYKWVTQIRYNNKSKLIGVYKDKQDAINARKEAVKKYYKEYGNENGEVG